MTVNTRLNRSITGVAAYALCFCLAQAEVLSGRVVKIADGDTLTVLDKSNRQHKIRLVGIDAPERGQPFGTVSRQNLAHLVFGKTVAVEWYKQDRYQRVLGKVLLDGQDINLEQINAGLAWHYKRYDKGQLLADWSLYARAEASARLNEVGLWRDSAPVAPWDFRRNRRTSVADEGCEITLAGDRYKVGPAICEIYRDALKSASTLSGLIDFARLAIRPGSGEAN